jgi:hypothetical protein
MYSTYSETKECHAEQSEASGYEMGEKRTATKIVTFHSSLVNPPDPSLRLRMTKN